MDARSRSVRQLLGSMAPVRSIPWIQTFQLAPDEEAYLIGRECHGKSTQQLALEYHVSVDTVVRKRRSALRKIAGAMKEDSKPSG